MTFFVCFWYIFLVILSLILPKFFPLKSLLPLFLCVIQPPTYRQTSLLFSIAWSPRKLGDQVTKKIIWSLNFFLFTFSPFVHFDFLYFLYFDFFEKKKSNINVDSASVLTTEYVESRFFYFKFFGKDNENDANTSRMYFLGVFCYF